jgi:23S rRNA (cytidine2498-2'-O)-methyltransferase
MTDFNSNFVFATCQIGAERALKAELLRDYGFASSFARPGFVTFKSADKVLPLGYKMPCVFARAYGVSLGAMKSPDDARILDTATALKNLVGRSVRLHVWQRDQNNSDDEAPVDADITELNKRLLQPVFHKDTEAQLGDPVLSVIKLDNNSWWLGAHVQTVAHARYPGGNPRVHMPSDSPSRAYRKIEEAIAWARPTLRAGDNAVELGSAPGGATYALLRRGVHVWGVDPGVMDAHVLSFRGPHDARCVHIRKQIGDTLVEELPDSLHWLVADMNVPPMATLMAVRRLVVLRKRSLRGVVLTLKLGDWDLASEIPSYLAFVRDELGLRNVRATQLPSHRQEIVVVGIKPSAY